MFLLQIKEVFGFYIHKNLQHVVKFNSKLYQEKPLKIENIVRNN